jgi:hypothetical protein
MNRPIDQLLMSEYSRLMQQQAMSPWANMQQAPQASSITPEDVQAEMQKMDEDIIKDKQNLLLREAVSKAFKLGNKKNKEGSSNMSAWNQIPAMR